MISILLVEDETILREAYKAILDLEGFVVEVAHDGLDALKKIKNKTYDLILLDLMMPGADGNEFLKKAHLQTSAPDTKVIAFSNLSSGANVEGALSQGAHEHILKSKLSPKQLIEMVYRVTSKK